MSFSIKAIGEGLAKKISRKREPVRFQRISWWQEKKIKHQDDKGLKTFVSNGLKLCYKRPYEFLHTYKELFEDEIYRFASSTSSPLIIDCGANIGLSVLYFKSIHPAAEVIAFEPDPDNFKLLEENCRINNLANVHCQKEAVWINNETLSFKSGGTQGSQITDASQTSNVIHVQAVKLADMLKSREVDLLKIDIEGAELEVIRDCKPYLSNVKYLFVEYHGKAEETDKLTELLTILKTHHRVYIKLAADNLSHPFVDKTTKGAFDVQLNLFCY